jgi:hypothetical protein
VGDFVGEVVGDFVGEVVGDFVGEVVGYFVGANVFASPMKKLVPPSAMINSAPSLMYRFEPSEWPKVSLVGRSKLTGLEIMVFIPDAGHSSRVQTVLQSPLGPFHDPLNPPTYSLV